MALLPVDSVNEANRVLYYDNEYYEPEVDPEVEPEMEEIIFRNSAAAGIDSILTEMEHEILLTGSNNSGILPVSDYTTGSSLNHDQLIAEMSKLDWDASGGTGTGSKKPEAKIGGLTIEEFIHFLALLERVKEEHLDPKRPLPATSGPKLIPELGRSSPYDNIANRIRNAAAMSPTSGGSSSGDSDSGDEYLLPEPSSSGFHRALIPDGVAVLEQLFRRRYLHVIPEEAGSDVSSRISRALSDLSGSEDPSSPLPADLTARLASALHDFPRSPNKSGSASGATFFFPQIFHDLHTKPKSKPEVEPEPEVVEVDESLLPVSVVMIQTSVSSGASAQPELLLPEILIQSEPEASGSPEADFFTDPIKFLENCHLPEVHPHADANTQTEAGIPECGSSCSLLRQMEGVALLADESECDVTGSQPLEEELEAIQNPESAADGNRFACGGGIGGAEEEEEADGSRDYSVVTSCGTDTHPASATGIYRAELVLIGSPSQSPQDNFQVDSEVDLEDNSEVNSEVNFKVDLKDNLEVGFPDNVTVDSKVDMREKSEVDDFQVDSKVELEDNSEVNFKVDSKDNVKVDSNVDLKDKFRVNSKVDLKDNSKVDNFKVNSKVDLKDNSKVDFKVDLKDQFKGNSKVDNYKVDFKDDLKLNSKVDLEDSSEVNFKDNFQVNMEDKVEVDLKAEAEVEAMDCYQEVSLPDSGSDWSPEEMSHPDAVSTPKLVDATIPFPSLPPQFRMIHPHRKPPEVVQLPARYSPEAETGYSTDNGPERPSLPSHAHFRFHPPIPPPPHRRCYTFQDNSGFRNAEEDEEGLKASLLAEWLQTGGRKRADYDRSSYSTISSTTLCSDSRNASAQESESDSESKMDYWRAGIPELRQVRMNYDRGGYSSGPELTSGLHFHPPEWTTRKLDHQLDLLMASYAHENYGEFIRNNFRNHFRSSHPVHPAHPHPHQLKNSI